jgi:hypothetical protein
MLEPVDPVAVDVMTVGRQFFGYVGRDQNHEHQRHGESEHVDRRIESVTVQKAQKKLEIECVSHKTESYSVLGRLIVVFISAG